ncbi:MAG: hypothetical protein OEY59_12920 [Deltaproteobacteria bacterium]|nr:hypothetical protein [Deltaproteobacteria bacterium]
MSANQIIGGSINQNALTGFQRNQKNSRNLEDQLLNPGSNEKMKADRSGQAKKAKEAASSKTDLTGIFEKNDKTKKSSEVNEYLKIISRLENRTKRGDLSQKDFDKVADSLDKKLNGMKDQQKKRLMSMKFFKDQKIFDLKNFKNTLKLLYNDEMTRDKIFGFLKLPEFMSILMDEPEIATTYAPPVMGQYPRYNA